MKKTGKKLEYVFGPVGSWRIGSSLGVDLLSNNRKVCNFDCSYCQLGKTSPLASRRGTFVDLGKVLKELESVPANAGIDYITFSGRGEPTLAANLGEAAEKIKKIRKEPLAILTNSGNMYLPETLKALLKIDFVIAKLDACDEQTFKKINRPAPGITFSRVLAGILKARKAHRGKFAIQTMLISENRRSCEAFAEICRKISPDEIQLNTPLRPSPVPPLSRKEVLSFARDLRRLLPGTEIKTVYEEEKPKVTPISAPETMLRRGKTL